MDFETVFEDGDMKTQARSLKISLKLNNAACKLKLKDYSEVIDLATKVRVLSPLSNVLSNCIDSFSRHPFQVLEGEPSNVKALYRRAQAYSALMDLELAEEDIKKALEVEPENRFCTFLFIRVPCFIILQK